MISYSQPLYRPPAEANNIILQVTLGCSYNHCSFCSMYKNKKFEVRSFEAICQDIDTLSHQYPDARRVFLADGDALCLATPVLINILNYLKKSFPKLNRVSSYATAQNLLEKSDEELSLLKTHKLSLIYFGIETGDDTLLEKIHKGVTASEMITALNKASKAKIKISATLILGLGSHALSKAHIQHTADLINQTTLNYLSTLQLGLDPMIKSHFLRQFDQFTPLNDDELLREQHALISAVSAKNNIIFRSNHASNALHLAGNLPKDQSRLLTELEQALSQGQSAFVPHYLRGF